MRGLSLVEIIVSMLIFLMVVILVFNLYPTSMIGLSKGEQRTRADRIAQTVLAQARSQAYSALPVGTTSVYTQDYNGNSYQSTLVVAPVAGNLPTQLKSLQVTVQWTERGQPRSATREVWVANVTR